MATKRYYWLKLGENFFYSNKIKILKKMENGYKFIVLYQEMMMKAAESDGKLFIGEDMPYDAEILSIVVDMDIKDVRAALEVFKRFGFIKVSNGVISIPNLENFVGSETSSARRMRTLRAKRRAQSDD